MPIINVLMKICHDRVHTSMSLLRLWLSFLLRALIIATRWLSLPAALPESMERLGGPERLVRLLPPQVPVTLLAALPPEALPPPPPPALGMLRAPVGLSKGSPTVRYAPPLLSAGQEVEGISVPPKTPPLPLPFEMSLFTSGLPRLPLLLPPPLPLPPPDEKSLGPKRVSFLKKGTPVIEWEIKWIQYDCRI